MKQKRRIFQLLLAFVMIFSAMPVTAWSIEIKEEQKYEQRDDETNRTMREYVSFVKNKQYEKYFKEYLDLGYQPLPFLYAFLDIDKDKKEELIIMQDQETGFQAFAVFTYDVDSRQVIPISVESREGVNDGTCNIVNLCYGGLEYSNKYRAIVFTNMSPYYIGETAILSYGYYIIQKEKMIFRMGVGTNHTEESEIYYDVYVPSETNKDRTHTIISEEAFREYIMERNPIEFKPTSEISVNETPLESGVSNWAREEVVAARNAGLIPESLENNYQKKITRLEFCQLVEKLLEAKTGSSSNEIIEINHLPTSLPFSDTQDTCVIVAYGLGIVNGTSSGKFSPDNSISREQAATMLTRLAKVLWATSPQSVKLSFSDQGVVSDWAYYSVNFISRCIDRVSDKVVMGGTSKNQFSPQGTYTREQAFISFLRMYHAVDDCSPDGLRQENTHTKENLQFFSLQGHLNYVIPMKNNWPLLGMKIPKGATEASDMILVKENGKRLDLSEYEVWIRPYNGEPLPAKIESDSGKIVAGKQGAAILTVQSSVTGTIWEQIYLYVAGNQDRLLLSDTVPVQLTNTIYGKQAYNFLNCGMYVEDYTSVYNFKTNTYHMTMTVYNTTNLHGSLDIYNEKGVYIGSKRIDKNDTLPDDAWEVIKDTFMIGYDIGDGNALTYRQNRQSKKTVISEGVDVPAGGLVVLSNNYLTSPGAFSYNLSGLLLDSANVAEEFAKLDSSKQEIIENSIGEALVEEVNKKVDDILTFESMIKNVINLTIPNVTVDTAAISAENIVTESIQVLENMNIDWNEVIKNAEEKVTKTIQGAVPSIIQNVFLKMSGPVGTVIEGMFKFSHTVELIPQIVQLKDSKDLPSTYILVKDDEFFDK